jgi:hypothetical protein
MTAALTWQDLRHRPARDLKAGDQWIIPPAFATYSAAPDGAVRGHGWEPPTGTLWRVVARDGDKVTAVDQDGRELTEALPRAARVLKVERRARVA